MVMSVRPRRCVITACWLCSGKSSIMPWAWQRPANANMLDNKTSRRVLCMEAPLLWWESNSEFSRNHFNRNHSVAIFQSRFWIEHIDGHLRLAAALFGLDGG